MRFLIAPHAGRALIPRDYDQQEVRIIAVKADDSELLAACAEPDVYMAIAKQLGFPDDLRYRPLFKVVVLGLLYGLEAPSLAFRTDMGLSEATEILARMRARFWRTEEYCADVRDYADFYGNLTTDWGWTVQCPPNTNYRTLRNWPIQSAGSEIMHAFCILAERRGLEVVAPVHDAFMVECDVADARDVARDLDRAMRDASALVLGGYEIPTSFAGGNGPILPGQRYREKTGAAMWCTLTRLIRDAERKAGERQAA
jgi:DNA polymerase I-like protein with 3'-5' exonuclease and polymerase domains